MSKVTNPPWEPEEVDALNAWQNRGNVHPFTCPSDGNKLVAHSDGWHCHTCDYKQTWAYAFMLKKHTWNHRVIRKKYTNGLGEEEILYGVHEVHYEYGVPKYVTEEPRAGSCETIDELKEYQEMILRAFDKPVLNYEDF